MNPRVVLALGRRDLRRYFTNPSGYVFLTLFILLSAAAAFWRPRFFSNNLANLDQLNETFPYLLLFFVPALGMSIWSEERKQGTDELLLTLPATELEIVLGKYAAVVGIYTASIALSLSHVFVLMWLGRPDLGLMTSNYIGYWLAGVALIPIAMLASLLTLHATIAFIVGCLFCALPVAIGAAAGVFNDAAGRRLAPLGLSYYFADFASGVVSLSGVLYFVFLAGFFVYLNVLVLGRRHLPPRTGGVPLWMHQTARAVATMVAVVAATNLSMRAHVRLDLTAGRMHSLSAETRRLVAELPAERSVLIQAFVSPDVPETYVQTRENLLSILREIAALGGGRVTTTVQETEPYSAQARLARERYGITPREVEDEYTGETAQEVFLGVVLTSGPEEQVIPFFERGLATEYEIARAMRVVSQGSRKRIGVIDGDVKMFGGVDFSDNQPRPQWQILDELRKQYEVVEIAPATAIKEKVDALLLVQPSRLTQGEMDLAEEPVRSGVPTMILADPLPALDIRLAPSAQMAAELDPYHEHPTSRVNYGDVRKMLLDLGINWVPARIAWDAYNPHPDMSNLPRETVFVAPGSGNADAFNRHHPATSGLQELLLLYPGYLLPVDDPGFTFDPLLETGRLSGLSSFFEVVRPSPAGLALNPSITHEPDKGQHVLAAQVRSKAPLSAPAEERGATPTNVIVIADLDLISDYFFDIRASAPVNASFDNITFFLDAMDVLAGDRSFIALRNRRVTHRSLDRVEAQTRGFMERRTREEQQAEKEAQGTLDAARSRLKSRLQEIEARRDLDAQAKQIMARNVEEVETRRLRVLAANIDQEKSAKIQASRETMEAEIRRIRGTIRAVAVLLPPVPVFLLGVAIFVRRQRREREGARAARRLRQVA